MPDYKNGYIPEGLLTTIGSGRIVHTINGKQVNEDWKQQLSPGTLAKWRKLQSLAKQHTGKDLVLTPGWSGYRPYAAQVLAKQLFGNGAAAPGYSSHGGFWEGKQTLAMDVDNWQSVYGTREKFYADVRAAGLEPGLITPSRGYPDEPWHIIDFDPWAAVPAGGGATPFDPQKEEPMFTIYNNGGGGYFVVGPDTFLEIGNSLSVLTGVDGPEALAAFTKAGAPTIVLDPRAYDVLKVHLRVAHGAQTAKLDDASAAKLAADIVAKLPASTSGASKEDVQKAIADALGGLVLKAA